MSKKNQERIFLCHATEDKEYIIEIYQKLQTAGLNPWLDIMDILPGQNWDREIRQALIKSRFIIIFFSKHSVSKRGYVQREFKLALDTLEEIPEGQIFIIPVRLDNCEIPESFRHIQYTDLFEDSGFEKILTVIRTSPLSKQEFSLILINRVAEKGGFFFGKPYYRDALNNTPIEIYIDDVKKGKVLGGEISEIQILAGVHVIQFKCSYSIYVASSRMGKMEDFLEESSPIKRVYKKNESYMYDVNLKLGYFGYFKLIYNPRS